MYGSPKNTKSFELLWSVGFLIQERSNSIIICGYPVPRQWHHLPHELHLKVFQGGQHVLQGHHNMCLVESILTSSPSHTTSFWKPRCSTVPTSTPEPLKADPLTCSPLPRYPSSWKQRSWESLYPDAARTALAAQHAGPACCSAWWGSFSLRVSSLSVLLPQGRSKASRLSTMVFFFFLVESLPPT